MMTGEHDYNKAHIARNPIPKKKEHIRVFIHRKRSSSGLLHKSNSSQSNNLKQLTSIIEKCLNQNKKTTRNNRHVILFNYKPVLINSRQQKSTVPKSSSTNHNSSVDAKTNCPPNRQSASFRVPDVEDPFMFIETMYQQLFTEDGQLRSGTEPEVLANCVKQIVTHSRRNSMAHRDSIASNIYQPKHSMSSRSFSFSSRFIPNIFNEEEEPNTLSQKVRTADTSGRSSKRSSINLADHHQQQLHAFLNSYYQYHKRSSTDQTTIKPDNFISVDDTDNEDLDTFSDLNSYRKTIRTSPPASIDEDTTHTDSKLLLSSGYQSLRSHQTIISKTHSENDHHYCSNCLYTPQIPVTSSTLSINTLQPIRAILTKYFNFILMSKNIFIVPLFIFLLHQRSIN